MSLTAHQISCNFIQAKKKYMKTLQPEKAKPAGKIMAPVYKPLEHHNRRETNWQKKIQHFGNQYCNVYYEIGGETMLVPIDDILDDNIKV